jgi:hypothetical protein
VIKKGSMLISLISGSEIAIHGFKCPNGKPLRLNVKKAIVGGVIYRRYVADRDNCKGCELKVRCITRNNAKGKFINIPVGSVPRTLSKAMAQKVDGKKGRTTYP